MAGVGTTGPPGPELGWAGWIGVGILAVTFLAALLAPFLTPYDPLVRSGAPFAPPDGRHWLGTDDVGRDLFTSLLHGARTSLLVGGGVAVLSTGVGAVIGMAAGASRGWPGVLLMRLVDVVLALPFLPLVVVVSAFAGRDLWIQIVLLSSVIWARPARILRAQTLVALDRGHVEAAVAMGAGPFRTLGRHVSYYTAPLLVPLFIRAAVIAILLEASLAFLGLGDPQRTSWGATLYWANARAAVLTDAWLWWVVPPGVAIAGLVTGLGLLGLVLEERLNPTLERGGPRAARG